MAAYRRSRKRFPECGQIVVMPLRITGSLPPGSPFQTVWWPTRTPATSVMALRGPAGRNPTGIPKSRARPLAGGGLDSFLFRELFQLELRVDLHVPVAIAVWPDPEEVIHEAGGEKDADGHQIADLLLGQGDDATDQPNDWRHRP